MVLKRHLIGDAEIAELDIARLDNARPENAVPDQKEVLQHSGAE